MWLNKDFGYSYTSNFTELNTLFVQEKKYSANNFSKRAFHTIYPEMSVKEKCTMMLLGNRAYPQWITAQCDEINHHITIVCMKYQTSAAQKIETNHTNCPTNYILNRKYCYDFIFFKGKTWTNSHVLISKRYLKLNSLKIFHFLFVAINVKLKSLLSVHYNNNTFIKQFSYEKYFSVITQRAENVPIRDSEGYFVKRINFTSRDLKRISGNLFSCKSGSFISSRKVCDETVDCGLSDNSDEYKCKCQTQDRRCKYITSDQKRTWKCSSFYFTGIDGKCYSFDHQYIQVNIINKISIISNKIKCINGNEIDTILIDDLVSDCGESGDDESVLKDILVNHNYYSCHKEGEIPCKNGHNRCFDFTDICVYRLNKYHHLVPCRTGGHLQECREFECNLKFKCPGSYCIPLSYVCDGKWDCHNGHDEYILHTCKARNCIGFFHCSKSSICFPVEDVCDNYIDCPEKDDELMCGLKNIKCPVSCSCHNFAIQCLGSLLDIMNIYHKLPYSVIKVSDTSMATLHVLKIFSYLVLVDFSNNMIISPCYILSGNKSILQLDLSKNVIYVLQSYCFSNLSRIELFYLNNNHLHTIEKKAFWDVPNMKLLNLSCNSLNYIPPTLLYNLYHFKVLSVVKNSFLLLNPTLFRNTEIYILQSDDYRICCIASSVKMCTATKLWYINCKNLLPTHTVRIFIIIVGSLVLVLSVLSLILQVKLRAKYRASIFPIIIICLNISDMLVSLYFIILVTAEFIYQVSIILYEKIWKRSFSCYLIFFTSLVFTIESPVLLSIISLARLRAVTNPLESNFQRHSLMAKLIPICTLSGLLLSILLTTGHATIHDEIPTTLCLPFIDPSDSQWFIKLITFITTTIQLSSSLFIVAVYILFVKILNKSSKYLKCNVSKKISRAGMIIQLFVVTFSNIVCWIPANAIYLISLYKSKYSTNLLIWTAIAVTPINSMINPFLFVITTIRKKTREIKSDLSLKMEEIHSSKCE